MTTVAPIGAIPRRRLSGRKKIGIIICCCLVAAGILLASHLMSAPQQARREPDLAIGGGRSFFTPATTPAVVDATPRPIPNPNTSPRPLPNQVSTGPKGDPDLMSPIFQGGSGEGISPATARTAKSTDDGDGAKDELSAALVHSDLGPAARATKMRHPELTVPAGTLIHCGLQTAINSQLVGFVTCLTMDEVRSATGTVTLMDRGTQMFGEVRSGLRNGQNRLFILWVRARTPENVIVSLDSPAADSLGRSGVPGYVNDHFWSKFWTSLLYSVVDFGPTLANTALQKGSSFGSYTQFYSPQQQLANTVLQDQLNVPPVLEKNEGDLVAIFVARDLDFSGVYELEATR